MSAKHGAGDMLMTRQVRSGPDHLLSVSDENARTSMPWLPRPQTLLATCQGRASREAIASSHHLVIAIDCHNLHQAGYRQLLCLRHAPIPKQRPKQGTHQLHKCIQEHHAWQAEEPCKDGVELHHTSLFERALLAHSSLST
eukprot:229336-Amphidinium_carterae.1